MAHAATKHLGAPVCNASGIEGGIAEEDTLAASVSPKLLDVYAEDGITLDQLMAFTVNGDQERQEQVPAKIRREVLL